MDTPHLFTHTIARTQEDRDEEFHNHKPYTGFAYRENLASFRRAESWIGRPSLLEEYASQAGEAAGEQHQLSDTEGEEPGALPSNPEGHLVMDQPVASSSVTPTYEQPEPLAEHLQGGLGPIPTSSRLTPPEIPNQCEWEAAVRRIILTTIKTPLPPLWPHFSPKAARRLLNVCTLALPCLRPFLWPPCCSS